MSLTPWRESVRDEWIDYNGHLSEAYYVLVLGHATDSVMAQLGMTADYVARTGTSMYTLEAHVRYLDQVPPGVELEVRSAVIGVGAKTLWLWHELYAEGRLRASEEILAVHVDATAGSAAPWPGAVRARLDELLRPVPETAGRAISIR